MDTTQNSDNFLPNDDVAKYHRHVELFEIKYRFLIHDDVDNGSVINHAIFGLKNLRSEYIDIIDLDFMGNNTYSRKHDLIIYHRGYIDHLLNTLNNPIDV